MSIVLDDPPPLLSTAVSFKTRTIKCLMETAAPPINPCGRSFFRLKESKTRQIHERGALCSVLLIHLFCRLPPTISSLEERVSFKYNNSLFQILKEIPIRTILRLIAQKPQNCGNGPLTSTGTGVRHGQSDICPEMTLKLRPTYFLFCILAEQALFFISDLSERQQMHAGFILIVGS